MAPKAKKKMSASRPWWGSLLLFIFLLLSVLFASMIETSQTYPPLRWSLITAASYIIYGYVVWLLILGLMLLVYRLAQSYDPKGSATDYSHIWVDAKSGRKRGDASVRSVYEHLHGYGSWEKRVKRERVFITVLLMLFAVLLIVYGVYYLTAICRLRVLVDVIMLLGSDLLYWLSYLGLAVIVGLTVFLLMLAFWDMITATSMPSPSGNLPSFTFNFPSPIHFLPRVIALIAVVLLNGFVAVLIFFPRLRMTAIGSRYTTMLIITYVATAFLWWFGWLFQDHSVGKAYQEQVDRQSHTETLKNAVQVFFGKDTTIKDRLSEASYLLVFINELTPEGRNGVIEVLKMLSGKDFGTDYAKWKRWVDDAIENEPWEQFGFR
ncbi:MAG: hypothetical protein V2J07_05705 [Anaerolineae bacterium]|jgi:hypothetical protein|nr:hypothetical protein [Anaerolineae bacterium]